MAQTKVPFYDPKLSYEDNYDNGPFGLFKELPTEKLKKGAYELFGNKLDVPFGIPAGPLLNGKFVEGAWNWGYSLPTYKTVRGNVYPTHPHPNVIRVAIKDKDIHPGDTVIGDYDTDKIDVEHDGITNSFGVPSKDPVIWQDDVMSTLAKMHKGNSMILSFMGTKTEEMSRDTYIDDFVRTCAMARETGAPILEVNFSCPNFGKEGLICNDLEMSTDILEALSKAKGNVPLLVKIGYFGESQREGLNKLIDAIHEYADGVCAINTISAKVVNEKGEQALPGNPVRLSSGICGSTIAWAGLEMAEYLTAYRRAKNWKDMAVIGVGGVTKVEDYLDYMKLGVNAVQSATGAMWKPDLAMQIRNETIK